MKDPATRHSRLSGRSTTPRPLPWPHCLTSLVGKDSFEFAVVMVILVNIGLNVYEIDARAQGQPIMWPRIFGNLFLLAYIAELALRIYIERREYFVNGLNVMDFGIVLADIVCSVLIFFSDPMKDFPSVTVFRAFRIVRLLRVIRTWERFHELWLMLHGMASAFKAMLWASILILVVLVLVSVLAVEVLHPVVQEITDDMGFGSCKRCEYAFGSVKNSMGTWFLLIFAGELWNDLAVPIMETRTSAVPVFGVAYVMINLGLLNLILTVIVDRASQARAEDQEQKVAEKVQESKRAKDMLLKVCQDMDLNRDKTLTLQELQRGYDENEDFASALELMDVGPEDIKIVFDILDKDGNGAIMYEEFVEQFHKMRCYETHTLLVFIKHYVHDVQRKVSEQLGIMKDELLVKTRELLGKSVNQEDEIQEILGLVTRVTGTSLHDGNGVWAFGQQVPSPGLDSDEHRGRVLEHRASGRGGMAEEDKDAAMQELAVKLKRLHSNLSGTSYPKATQTGPLDEQAVAELEAAPPSRREPAAERPRATSMPWLQRFIWPQGASTAEVREEAQELRQNAEDADDSWQL